MPNKIGQLAQRLPLTAGGQCEKNLQGVLVASETGVELAKRARQGDRVALARLISRVEDRAGDLAAVMAEVHAHRTPAYCVGITGPPGAGKSTLADRLITAFRDRGQTVGVLAVDPSSPFSGGAVLGDRIRMQRHTMDDGVYIRSLGSRGRHGGVSRATRDIRAVLELAGMDIVLLETVGVGQTELDVMEIADTTVVILVPEAGDAVQTLKAGLLEIADVFVVNKSDREGADRMLADLRTLVMMRGERDGWETPLLATVGTTGKGVPELMEALDAHRRYGEAQGSARGYPLATVKAILEERLDANLDDRMQTDPALADVARRLEAGEIDPHTAADEVARILADAPLLNPR